MAVSHFQSGERVLGSSEFRDHLNELVDLANDLEDKTEFVSGKPGIVFPAFVPFVVSLTKTGGTAGSKTTQCSFTYTVTHPNGVVIGTSKSPLKQRPALGVMVSGDGLKGLAYYDEDGAVFLFDANETLDVETC